MSQEQQVNQNEQQESQPQSSILSEEQVNQVLNPEESPNDDVQLPSEEAAFEMPEKFAGKSAEEIARAYLELEKMRNKPAEETPPDDEPPADEPPVDEKPTDTPVPTKDLLDEYIEKARNNGGVLSEEHYNELAEKGFDKDTVDIYAAGITAQEQAKAVATLEKAGVNPTTYQEAIQWAKDNLSEAEITAYNESLVGANEAAIGIITKDLVAKYKAGSTPEGKTIHSTEPSTQKVVKGYADKSEMQRDINDPRYQKDPRFNAMVADKIAETDWL